MSTTIITRLYADTKSADAVKSALLEAGQNKATIDVIHGASARKRMTEARVNPEAADAYAKGVESGKALLVVRAPFFPLGTALKAIRIVDDFKSIDVGVKNQNLYIRDEPGYAAGRGAAGRGHAADVTVLPKDRLYLTSELKAGSVQEETMSGRFGWPLLTKDRPRDSVIHGGAFMLPFPKLTRDRHRDSVMHGDVFMSKKIIPYPLLSPDRPRDSVMHGEDTTISSKLGLPLLAGRR